MSCAPVKAVAAAAQPPRSPAKAGMPTTLLDVHEVEWITRELERLLVRESGRADAGDHHRRKRAKVSPAPKPQANKGGFLTELIGKHAVSVCGGTVAAAGVSGRRRPGRGNFREVDKV